jgi:uncharacterized protein
MLTTGRLNGYNYFCLFGVMKMRINVKERVAKGKPETLQETLDLSGLLEGRQDLISLGELRADLVARAEGDTVVVEGSLELTATLVCSRCLGPAEEHLTIPFRETFTREPVAADSAERQDDELHHIQEDCAELTPYVEEAVWMALAYVPLCKADCKGLCPECGTNRNEQECGCSTEKLDPRFADLADLFKNKTEDPQGL